MPTSSVVGRIAAVLALLGAVIVVLLLVLGGGSSYTVTAEFQNASQLVTGNKVNVAGVPVGSVKQISLSDDGQALVKMEISDSAYTPLPDGTQRHGPLPVALGDRQPLRRPRPAGPARRQDDRLRRHHLPGRHHLRGRPRPALQHPRQAHRRSPEAGDPGLRPRLRGGGPEGEPRLPLPEPLPLHLAAGLRRAQLRPGEPRGPGRGRRRAHLHPRSEEPRRSPPWSPT